MSLPDSTFATRTIRIRGQVQGVGFRPFVWRLAKRFGIGGEVLNDAAGVLIRATGSAANLDKFMTALREEAPPLARVEAVESEDCPAIHAAAMTGFRILESGKGEADTGIIPDAASCAACLAEIRDAGNRRFGHVFANCTDCGPRFSIIRAIPYDRASTTMAGFAMCKVCRREYDDPADRRFHAQPVACPGCGPRLRFEAGGGAGDIAIDDAGEGEGEGESDAIAKAIALLRKGGVLAVKGLGGFHLAVDAMDNAAVLRLRQRKNRPGKPLALMGHMEHITAHAHAGEEEKGLLASPAAPIVLLARKGRENGNAPAPAAALAPEIAPDIAPGQARLGWMLPYTPLHHLLLDGFGGALVMTSANISAAPQITGNEEARRKLGGIADGYLMHDRDIARRLDDGMEAITAHGPMILRRGRGRVPDTLLLPPGFEAAPQVVAFGGDMKTALCLLKNNTAMLGHHLGDMDNAESRAALRVADHDYAMLMDHAPEIAACDLHPDFFTTRHAEATGLPVARVQHHHAHLAACMAENLWPLDDTARPVAGIILDGLGLGEDGTFWGGEVLVGGYREYRRAAHLVPAPLAGGDAAAHAPWRNLLMRLDAAGLGHIADDMLAQYPIAELRRAVEAGVNAPLSSSVGRLFDAFAAALDDGDGRIAPPLLGYEGEAAMHLEALALSCTAKDIEPYPFGADLDPAPLFNAWAEDVKRDTPKAVMAWRFHAAIASGFADVVRPLAARGAIAAIALSGGCMQNMLLRDLLVGELADSGVPVLLHAKTPANDGGLALGQAVIAAARAL